MKMTIEITKKESEEKNKEEDNESENNMILVDPFEGVEVTFLGYSPFITANVDTSKCDEIVQNRVLFDFEDDNYALGDKITITAVAIEPENKQKENIKLLNESREYIVKDTGKWVTDEEDLDFDLLTPELEDKLVASTTQRSGYKFGNQTFENPIISYAKITSVSEPTLKSAYFVSCKPTSYDSDDDNAINYYIRFYDFVVVYDHKDETITTTITSCVRMENVKIELNGETSWEPELSYSDINGDYDQIVNDEIFTLREKYNVTEITDMVD